MIIGKDKLKVTFVCPPENLSGGNRVVAIYADQLTRRGCEVVVVTAKPTSLSLRERLRSLVGRRASLPRHLEKERSYYRNASFKVHRINHAGPINDADLPDADVLIATWWETAEWVWAASGSKGVKLHFMQDYETWGAGDGNVARVDASVALPIPKIVIAQWVADLLEKRWAQTPIALVPNSVETDLFFAPPRGKQSIPTVGFAYRTMRNKGCDIIVSAIERARKLQPNLRVMAFGLERPVSSIPLPRCTQYYFRIEDEKLRNVYAACDAWLFGTRVEGFGLPLLEAMACRTPVIGTPAGAASTLIRQGGGILVDLEDDAGMCTAILRVAMMADAEWRAMSDAAYGTAHTYTWCDAAEKFEAALRQAVAGEKSFLAP